MGKVIILGTAHLATTPGKCSPDGRFKEYAFSREVVTLVESRLKALGYTVYVDYMATEPNAQMKGNTWRAQQNNELKYRVGVVNSLCGKYGAKNCVYVSIHVNAAGADGKWHKASGVSVFVCPGASTNSQRIAKIYTSNAIRMELTGDRSIQPAKYWISNLYVLRNTLCPAILTENMFQDNLKDVNFLLSDEGRDAIVDLHVKTITQYCEANV